MNIDLIQITCCSEGCGTPFWIDSKLNARLLETKRHFYCPNGHSQHYLGESHDVKLRRVIDEKHDVIAELEQLKKKFKKATKKKA